MKKKIILLSVFLLAIMLLFYFKRILILDSEIFGKYEFVNKDGSNGFLNTPTKNDVLILQKSLNFKSNYWGVGKYEIERTFLTTRINLFYMDEFGGGQETFNVEKSIFGGDVRISINKDLNKYYYKI
ncbi:hypothetical protein [Flavobacterium sp.]|jgi:hypothetical protein|uniref:hypothetical protein n=1 Tax=Flavobacterium sp. TaxID=239 RepID=UPI0037BECF3F